MKRAGVLPSESVATHEDGSRRDDGNRPRAMRLCGYFGMTGAAILMAGDLMMFGVPASGAEMKKDWLAVMNAMPPWRLIGGGLAGPIGAWFYAIGFWQAYLALEPAGRRLAFLSFAALSMAMICIAGAFHATFPVMAYIAEAEQNVDGLSGLGDQTLRYVVLLFLVCAVPATAALLYMAYATWYRTTHYPRWFVVMNPLLLINPWWVLPLLPAPLGGPLSMAYPKLMFLVFFGVSTIVLRDGGKASSNASR